MAWGRRDGGPLTGNVSIAAASTTLTGTDFLTQLKQGTFVTVPEVVADSAAVPPIVGSPAQEFKVVSVTNATTAIVTPEATTAVTNQPAVVNDKPSWLNSADAGNVQNVSVAESQLAANRKLGIKSPGWHSHHTYNSGPGGTIKRTVNEILVAMKKPTN